MSVYFPGWRILALLSSLYPLPVLPSSSLRASSLWLTFSQIGKLSNSSVAPQECPACLLMSPPPPTPPGSISAVWALCSATEMQTSGQGYREIFFFKCLVGILKRGGGDKLSVLYHSTLSGRMTHFYLMTLFIKCLLPIKIEKWGQGRKRRQKLIYFLRLSLKFGLKFLGSFIIFVGKIGLANVPSWSFPVRLFTSIFVGIGLVCITSIITM